VDTIAAIMRLQTPGKRVQRRNKGSSAQWLNLAMRTNINNNLPQECTILIADEGQQQQQQRQ